MRHFNPVLCHYIHDSMLYNGFILIKPDTSYLKQHGYTLIFLSFLQTFDSQSKNIMGFLKSVFKFPLSPYTLLQNQSIAWCKYSHNVDSHKFCLLFLNIVRSRKEEETQNCSNSNYCYNFYHWLSESIWVNSSVLL